MQLLSSKKSVQKIKNIIHQDTQLHEQRIDLTVASIHRLNGAGSLDFGGSEFEPAASQSITPENKNTDDDYGWWKLKAGSYKAIFNEELSLEETQMAIISLHEHARQAGLSANTSLITQNDEPDFIIQIPECGCNIKKNARITTLYLFEIG